VSNRALHVNAVGVGLPPWIQSRPLVPKLWTPFLVHAGAGSADDRRVDADVQEGGDVQAPAPGKKSKKQRQQEEVDMQWLGDKVHLTIDYEYDSKYGSADLCFLV
jgi:endoribonuclease Dicer